MRRAWPTIKKALWLATTPLALTILLASPVGASGSEPAAKGGHEPAAGGHHVITNPIQNFTDFGYGKKKTEDGHKMPPPFSMALVNFGILLFLIGKTIAPGIAKTTRERHDQIAKALSEGKRLREEAELKLKEYKAKLEAMDAEIAAMTAAIRADAEAEQKRVLADAKARAERMLRDATQQIQAEIGRVRATLEREAVEAAVAAAERILREKTSEDDQKLLADRFVKSLQEAAGNAPVAKS